MKSRPIALGGVLAALAVVLLMLGGLIPIAIYISPMLASGLLLLLLAEMPRGLCLGWYGVVSLLAVLLCPDPETALVFVFLGWYPVAKPGLDRLPRLLRVTVKLLIFNLCVAALYGLLIWVFRLQALLEEMQETGAVTLIVLILMGNLSFVLFDQVLDRMTRILANRPKQIR